MFIFVADETNKEPGSNTTFFIYGGVIINCGSIPEVVDKLIAIRSNRGYSPRDKFKWDTNSRPRQVTIDNFRLAKNDVLEMCPIFDIKFIAYAVHHEIAGKQRDRKWLYALKTVFCGYDLFLQRCEAYGICLVDHFPDCLKTLGRINRDGIDPKLHGGNMKRKLDQIICYGAISIETTHLASIADIVLGAFRYCVNQSKNDELSAILYKKVRPLLVSPSKDPTMVEGWGLFLSPKNIKVPEYQLAYQELRNRLLSLE